MRCFNVIVQCVIVNIESLILYVYVCVGAAGILVGHPFDTVKVGLVITYIIGV